MPKGTICKVTQKSIKQLSAQPLTNRQQARILAMRALHGRPTAAYAGCAG